MYATYVNNIALVIAVAKEISLIPRFSSLIML